MVRLGAIRAALVITAISGLTLGTVPVGPFIKIGASLLENALQEHKGSQSSPMAISEHPQSFTWVGKTIHYFP